MENTECKCEGKCASKVPGVYKKLLKFQQSVNPIKKDSTNPHFRNKYFDINGLLEEVKPKLNAAGLIVVQTIDGFTLTSSVIDVEDGSRIECACALPDLKNDPQKMGSAMTYMRRYSLQALLGLEGEDADCEGFYDRSSDRKPVSNKVNTATTKAPETPAPKVEGQQPRKTWTKPVTKNEGEV